MPKKITIKVEVRNEKDRSKAMKLAVRPGVHSVTIEGEERDQLVVTGEGVDSVKLASILRKKKLGHATIMSVQDVKKNEQDKNKAGDDDDDDDKDKSSMECIRYCPYLPTPYYQQVVYDPQPHNSCFIL